MTPSSVADWVEEVTTSDTWAQVVARAWADEAFEARLMTDPAAVLHEAGLEVPIGMELRVQEASEEQEAPVPGAHLVLPPKPAMGECTVEPIAYLSRSRASVICTGGGSAKPQYCNF